MSFSNCQIETLGSLGYSRKESEFLYLVAIHSGYFTHRQFLVFSHNKPGRASDSFLSKLLKWNHADATAFKNGGKVYHLFSRKIYKAIGHDNLRTRRRHQLEYLKTRLVALDFVLDNPGFSYLETEADKVPFFERELHITSELMPCRIYGLGRTAEPTKRYFVDRFPIFQNPLPPSLGLALTYVDFGSPSLRPFRSHLASWGPFLRALPPFQFLYLAPTPRLFAEAEAEFYRSVFGNRAQVSTSDVLRYFDARKQWDNNQRVASSDVLFLKEAQARYSDVAFQSLYEKYRVGNCSESEIRKTLTPFSLAFKGPFRSVICGSSLRVFEDPRAKSAESCNSANRNPFSGQFSEA
jgi:hypothetical protein